MRRALLRLSLPLYIGQMAIVASGLIDTLMAGRLSTLDLAAVGVAASIQTTITMLAASLLMALPPLLAHHAGAADQAAMRRDMEQSLWWVFGLSLLAMLTLLHPAPWLALAQLRPTLAAKVTAYLQASAAGVPAMLLLRVFMGLYAGLARTRPVMLVNLLYLAAKPALNSLCMQGLAMGAAGCALASSIDASLLCLGLIVWSRRQPELRALLPRALPPWPAAADVRRFLHLGLPIAMTFAADLSAFTLMALLIARLGTIAVAAHQIAANLVVLAFMWPMSLGQAATLLIGRALGERQPEQARRQARLAIQLALGCALAVSLGLALGAAPIAAFYSPDPQVQALARTLIHAVALYHLADALQVVAVSALRGYHHTLLPMLVYTICLWGIGLGGGILLGLTPYLRAPMGAPGFWLAAMGSLYVVALLMLLDLARVARRAIRPGPL